MHSNASNTAGSGWKSTAQENSWLFAISSSLFQTDSSHLQSSSTAANGYFQDWIRLSTFNNIREELGTIPLYMRDIMIYQKILMQIKSTLTVVIDWVQSTIHSTEYEFESPKIHFRQPLYSGANISIHRGVTPKTAVWCLIWADRYWASESERLGFSLHHLDLSEPNLVCHFHVGRGAHLFCLIYIPSHI